MFATGPRCCGPTPWLTGARAAFPRILVQPDVRPKHFQPYKKKVKTIAIVTAK
jgi:hypothetical protein